MSFRTIPLRLGLLVLLGGLSLWAPPGAAQPAPDSVSADTTAPDALHAQALAQEDGIILRWGPASPRAWRHGNEVGYRVERLPVTDGTPGETYASLTNEPVRPWNEEAWNERAQRDNRTAALATHLLYGDRVEPEMDAGLFPRMRNQVAEEANRHGFALFVADLDSVAAEGLGLRYVDRPEGDADEYLYRVFVDRQPDAYAIDTAYVLVDPEPQERRRVLGLEATSERGQIELGWRREAIDGAAFTAFHVERATSEDGPFERLTAVPLLSLDDGAAFQYADTSVTAGTRYTYRVIGLTPFGTESRGTTVTLAARDHVSPPPPVIDTVAHRSGAAVEVQWTLANPPADLDGFYVGRGSAPDGPFEVDREQLLPADARSHVDSLHVPGQASYVVVLAADTAGNVASSVARRVVVIDETPPAAPTGLTAQADTTGRVVLNWALGDDSDLMGYRVYWANQGDHTFTLLTPDLLADTTFADTLQVRSLTQAAFYEVAALDANYNPSERTRVRVQLPDVVPPTAPVLRGARASERDVQLAWVPSSSADVAQHHVVRRPVTDEVPWDTLAALSGTADAYADTTVTPGTRYTYSVVAEDSTGHQTAAERAVHAQPYDTGIRPGVEALEGTVEDGRVRLTWRHRVPAGGEAWYVVYRGRDADSLQRLDATDEPTYEDGRVVDAGAYVYAIQVKHRDGGVSRRSAPIQVTVTE